MYIDESGDTTDLAKSGSKFLVLTGCIIHENNRVQMEDDMRAIKKKYYQNPDVEIKSNFLRYANPDTEEHSPIKLHSRDQYNALEDEVTNFLQRLPCTLFVVAIDKEHFWQIYPSKNPYNYAYVFLVERFQYFLQDERSLGIAILDPREGQVTKHYIGQEIDQVHHLMRFQGSNHGVNCSLVVERVLFSSSDLNVGIQIADLYSYPSFHVLEYKKKASEYWRFEKTVQPKLRLKNGKLDGIGFKVFPEVSKNGLALYSGPPFDGRDSSRPNQ